MLEQELQTPENQKNSEQEICLMEVVDTTQINSFAPIAAQTNFPVSPSEDAVFITSSQLQEIISQAVRKAIQPLLERIEFLEDKTGLQDEKIAALESTLDTHAENSLIQLRLINDLRGATKPAAPTPPQGAKTLARIAKLKDFLKARGGGATFQECERLLAIHPNQMTKLVSMLDKRSFEVFTRVGDDRQRVLRLKAQIVSRER